MTGLAYPKPRPAALDRAERRKAQQARDRRESAKVKARSGGRCEVVVEHLFTWQVPTGTVLRRCVRRAEHVHHLIKPRGVGVSALAIHKQHVCAQDHHDIEGGVGGKRLIRVGGPVPLWTDTYRRVR